VTLAECVYHREQHLLELSAAEDARHAASPLDDRSVVLR
jgi:hypothetical protein